MINKIGINNYTLIQNETKQKKVSKKENIKISKVEEIKRAIENGTYKIDIEKTAKAMAEQLK